MHAGKIMISATLILLLAGCEQAREFQYYVKNRTNDSLNIFVEYSISARGDRDSDTLSILPGNKKQVYTHEGLGGFYTGAIKSIRFTGRDTLKQAWRNRGESEISKHFFRRDSWKLTHRNDDEEHYLFLVRREDLKMKPESTRMMPIQR